MKKTSKKQETSNAENINAVVAAIAERNYKTAKGQSNMASRIAENAENGVDICTAAHDIATALKNDITYVIKSDNDLQHWTVFEFTAADKINIHGGYSFMAKDILSIVDIHERAIETATAFLKTRHGEKWTGSRTADTVNFSLEMSDISAAFREYGIKTA